MHTCRKWRRIALASQGALRLRLFCTHGTPVQKTLHFWPALPIVVEYGGLPTLDPPVPEDEDNIIAALRQSDRVISISLTITNSLMEKLSAIEKPFSKLQDLVLRSRDGDLLPVTLPITFRFGQRLRRLHSTGIEFPALLQPLYLSFSTNLIDLQLHDAFLPWEFSPVILKNVLSEITQLRSLSLHFRSSIDYRFPVTPYGERVVLPVLKRLIYRGSMAYLESIVVMIDSPFLEGIEITFDHDPFLTLPKFKMFIDEIEMDRSTSHRGAHILSSEPTILMSLKMPEPLTHFRLQSSSKPSLMQISSVAQIGIDLSTLLFNDEVYTHASTTRRSGWMACSHSGELLEPLNLFTDEKSFHLDVNHWIQPRQHEDVLPPIAKLYIPQPGPCHAFVREAVVSVMISCRLSGHPIEVEYEQPCNICETGTVFVQCTDHYLLT